MVTPFAPHLSEELFYRIFPYEHHYYCSVGYVPWLTYDQSKTVDSEMKIPVTVDGKKKTVITVKQDMTEDELCAFALADGCCNRCCSLCDELRLILLFKVAADGCIPEISPN